MPGPTAPTTSCLEDGEDVDGVLEDERCADEGPFQGRFLVQELILVHCEFLSRPTVRGNRMENGGLVCGERGRVLRVCPLAQMCSLSSSQGESEGSHHVGARGRLCQVR